PASEGFQEDFRRFSNALTTGGASVGTCALHERVFTGTRSSLVCVGFRRASLIAAASSPAGAIVGPIRKIRHQSRCESFVMRDAMVHVAVTEAPSTCGTKRPTMRGGSFSDQNAALGVHVTWNPASGNSCHSPNSPVSDVRNRATVAR